MRFRQDRTVNKEKIMSQTVEFYILDICSIFFQKTFIRNADMKKQQKIDKQKNFEDHHRIQAVSCQVKLLVFNLWRIHILINSSTDL